MKKNRAMRIAALLLVLTMMTSCFVGGTFAKYTSGDNGSDMARVAKWGVEVEVKNFDMFTTDYKTDDATATFTGDYSVSSATGDRDDVMAPGTSGTFTNIAIKGTPEVAVDVIVEATVAVDGNWVIDGDFYCPVVITVGTTAICGLKYDNATDFANDIAAAIEGYSEQYGPNTDMTTIDANFDISWAWAFEDADHVALACDCAAGAQTDTEDTKLGDRAVAEDLTISIGIEITVDQID